MIRLAIEGMTCNHCTAAVKQALEAVPGVRDARVDLATGEAVVEGTAEPKDLVAAVEAEGYGAREA